MDYLDAARRAFESGPGGMERSCVASLLSIAESLKRLADRVDAEPVRRPDTPPLPPVVPLGKRRR